MRETLFTSDEIMVDDYVRIARKPTSVERRAWDNTWVNEMDACVGRIGPVRWVEQGRGVSVQFDYNAWFFPMYVLEKV